MRLKLQNIGEEERHIFFGTFERFGSKTGYKGMIKTVLLINIEDQNNNIITDHLWFNLTKGFEKLDLKKGDKIKFNGRVKPYVKGYCGRRMDIYAPISLDYSIYYPTKVEIVERNKELK